MRVPLRHWRLTTGCLHVRLKRPFLQEALKRALKPTVPFWATMSRLAVFVNDDRSRTFLAFEVDRGSLAPVRIRRRHFLPFAHVIKDGC